MVTARSCHDRRRCRPASMHAMPESLVRRIRAAHLGTGARVSLIGAVLLLVGAVYCLVVPVNMPTAEGVFGCGSGLYPPTESFAVGVCQDLARIQQVRAGTLAVAAVVLALLGVVFFGRGSADRPDRPVTVEPAAVEER